MRCRWSVGLILVAASGCPAEEVPSWPQVGAPLPEVTGVDQRGQPFSSGEVGRDGATLLFFGYTFCPDVCPITLLTMKRLQDGLPPEAAARLQIVFVTVDPERDTVERLASYLEAVGTKTIGVRPSDLEALKRDLKLVVEHEPVEPVEPVGTATTSDLYSVNHTATMFLIGPDGRLAERFSHGTSAEEMRGPVLDLLEAEKR